MENKIKYGLKNVYYAIATIDSNGAATYGEPVAFPGAVSLSLDPQGDTTPFYADNIVYWTGISNTGYEGTLEVARVIDSFKTDVLGFINSEKHVLLEDAGAEAVHFALLFQFEGDKKATRHVMYNCTATRPSTGSSTKNETVEPGTESLDIRATSIYVAGVSGGKDIVKAESVEGTDATVYSSWFTTVYVPTGVASN
jgi:phi13 family phage major tail protein